MNENHNLQQTIEGLNNDISEFEIQKNHLINDNQNLKEKLMILELNLESAQWELNQVKLSSIQHEENMIKKDKTISFLKKELTNYKGNILDLELKANKKKKSLDNFKRINHEY